MALTERNKLRVLIGDTAGVLFTNDELDFFLDIAGSNLFEAARSACLAIATNAAKSAIAFSLSGLNINKTQITKFFMDLSDKFKDAARTGQAPKQVLSQLDYAISRWGQEVGEVFGDTGLATEDHDEFVNR